MGFKSHTFQLKFIQSKKLATNIYAFYFLPSSTFLFSAGQYIQITLPHEADEKGTTRYFSIASSPAEKELMIVTKLPSIASDKRVITSFKQQMLSLKQGDTVDAFGPIGKFVLED
jgi:glycine betaine catabolism B